MSGHQREKKDAEDLHLVLHDKNYAKKREEIVLQKIMETKLDNRIEIAHQYLLLNNQTGSNVSLYEDIKTIIGGDFGECACLCFLTPLEFIIKQIEYGMKKKDDRVILEQITPRNSDELLIVQDAYKRDTGNDLLEDLEKIWSKDPMKTHVKNIFHNKRNILTNPNDFECEKCANTLAETPEKQWLQNQNIFKDIFLKKSPEELDVIGRFYFKKTGKNIVDVIEKLDKQEQNLLKEVMYNNMMPFELFAMKVNEAIKGLGTNEALLNRAIVARCELDMSKMREMYQYKFKVSMKEDIIGDTSGNYQKLVVHLAGK